MPARMLERPKSASALSLGMRNQLAQVKSMANRVSRANLHDNGLHVEDLTTGRLLLNRDSDVTVTLAADAREAEMRDIVDRRQGIYNRGRLVSDKKEDVLSKMMIELDVLEAAKARNTDGAKGLRVSSK